jgi:hypothetical protein
MNFPELDALLTRDQIAAELTKAGFPIRPKTLATKASRGGGPVFQRFGAKPLYRWRDALVWAEGRLGPPLRNTSQKSVGAIQGGRQDDLLNVPAK